MRIFPTILKWILAAGILLATVWMFSERELVRYGWKQLQGQLHIMRNARPVEEVLSDPHFPDSLKEKLRMTLRIRTYAIEQLGLKNSDNYKTIYDQKGQPVLWVITACQPYALEEYLWTFPFLGSVPYKGYFDYEKGMAESERLRGQGLDVSYTPVAGWSTLGWLSEPLLSNMLRRQEGELAELIIHELVHATAYFKDSTDYNENLATFVGEQGARSYLETYHGKGSNEATRYAEYLKDEEVYGQFMLSACDRLGKLYEGFAGSLNDSNKKQLKDSLIARILIEADSLPLCHRQRYRHKPGLKKLPDNTFFMSYRRYRRRQDNFKDELDATDGGLREFIRQKAAGNPD